MDSQIPDRTAGADDGSDALDRSIKIDPAQFFDDPVFVAHLAEYLVPADSDVLEITDGPETIKTHQNTRNYIRIHIPEINRGEAEKGQKYYETLRDDIMKSNVIVMTMATEFLENPVNLLKFLAKTGRPVVCSHWTAEFVRTPQAPCDRWLRQYTTDDFVVMATFAGFDIAFRMLFAGGQLLTYLLLPADTRTIAPWWFGRDGQRFLKQRKKRGERQIENYLRLLTTEGWHPSPKWAERSAFAAKLIPPGLRIMDVGCGGMYFEKYTAPALYRPVDVAARDARTRIHDLNAAALPADWIDEVDLVSFLGVLEYVNDPACHLRQIAGRGRAVLCTYNVAERRSRRDHVRWTTGLDTGDFEETLRGCGFRIERRLPYSDRQMVYLALPAAAAAPQDWWQALPPEPAPADSGPVVDD